MVYGICDKHIYKSSIRINGKVKSIIDRTNSEVCRKTGLKLSYGKVARAFWESLAADPALRKKCMKRVCKRIMKEKALKNVYRAGKTKNRRKGR